MNFPSVTELTRPLAKRIAWLRMEGNRREFNISAKRGGTSLRNTHRRVLQSLAILAALPLCLAVTINQVKRLSLTPIIVPQGQSWESAGTFNPAVVQIGERFVMLYRAQDTQGTSRLGYAESTDGIHFTRRPEPVFVPETDYEKDGGVEDPRIVKIGDLFYMTYTGYNKKDAQLCLAASKDLIHWERKGILLPAYKGNWNVGWTKSGAIVADKSNGHYWMYWLGTAADHTDQMGLSFSDDLVHWTEATPTPVLPSRPGKFDSRVVEPGPPPQLTSTEIILIYNGADDSLVYRTGIAVFDRKDPRKLLYRSDIPIFGPELDWEKRGQVPNVVFVEGLAARNGKALLYYGGADKYIGVAEVEGPLISF